MKYSERNFQFFDLNPNENRLSSYGKIQFVYAFNFISLFWNAKILKCICE